MSIIETVIDIPMEHVQNVCGQFDAYLKENRTDSACYQ